MTTLAPRGTLPVTELVSRAAALRRLRAMPPTGKPEPSAPRRWGSHRRPAGVGEWRTGGNDPRDLPSVSGILTPPSPIFPFKPQIPQSGPSRGKVAEAGTARERGCDIGKGAACRIELASAASFSPFLRKEALWPQQPGASTYPSDLG